MLVSCIDIANAIANRRMRGSRRQRMRWCIIQRLRCLASGMACQAAGCVSICSRCANLKAHNRILALCLCDWMVWVYMPVVLSLVRLKICRYRPWISLARLRIKFACFNIPVVPPCNLFFLCAVTSNLSRTSLYLMKAKVYTNPMFLPTEARSTTLVDVHEKPYRRFPLDPN